MTAEVRSVLVRLEADVAKYVADMKMAGAVTDQAFSSAHRNLDKTDASLQRTTKSLGQLETQARVTSPSMTNLDTGVSRLSVSSRRAGPDIDRLSGRVKLLAQAATLGVPALIGIGAVGVPAVTGLAAGFGAAALAGGSLLIATQGVGDAVSALEAARLDPTVENLEKAQLALDQLGPHAQQFAVAWQQQALPVFRQIRDSAAAGWFPGLTDSLDELEDLAPRVGSLLEGVGAAGGRAVEDSLQSLDSSRWDQFWTFLDAEAPQIVDRLSTIMGDLSHGAAEMWMAFDPGNDDFLGFIGDAADGFDRWASSDKGRQDVAAFLDYARDVGPDVLEFFSATVDMLAQLTQAAAPLAGPVLDGLTAIAKVIGSIADSDLGTPIFAGLAALSLYNRALATTRALQTSALGQSALGGIVMGQRSIQGELKRSSTGLRTFGSDLVTVGRYGRLATDESARLTRQMSTLGKTAGLIGGLAVITTGVADSFGLTNTASLALMGTLGGLPGVVGGAAVGAFLDLRSASDDLATSLDQLQVAGESGDLSVMKNQLAEFDAQLQETAQSDDPFDWLSDSLDAVGLDAGEARAVMNELRYDIGVMQDDLHRVGGETALRNLLDPTKQIQEGFEGVADAAGEMADAIREATAFATRQGDFDAWKASILDANQALRENGQVLDENGRALAGHTRAGLEARALLRGMGEDALQFATHLRGVDRDNFLANARQQIIQTAQDFGMGEKAARRLANEMELLGGKNVRAKADLDDSALVRKQSAAMRRLALIDALRANPDLDLNDTAFLRAYGITKADLAWLDRFKANPNADLDYNALKAAAAAARRLLASLDGDTATTYIKTVRTVETRNTTTGGIPKYATAEGGYIRGPGTTTSDSIPALLSDKEYVVRAAAVDKYGVGFMHRLNAMQLAGGGLVANTHVRRFAAGGLNSTFTGPGVPTGPPRSDFYYPDGVKFEQTFQAWSDVLRDDLRERRKDLSRRSRLLEKEVQARQDHLNELQQARQSFEDAIRSRLTQSVWGGQAPEIGSLSLEQALKGEEDKAAIPGLIADLEGRLAAGTLQALQDAGNVEQLKALVEATDAQLASWEHAWKQMQLAADPLERLAQQIREGNQLEVLAHRLRDMGLSDEAFRDLVSTASVEEIQDLFDRGRADVRRYQRLFEQRALNADQFAEWAGNDQFGADMRVAREELQESRKELRTTNRQLENVKDRLSSLEKTNNQGHNRTQQSVDRLGGKIRDAAR